MKRKMIITLLIASMFITGCSSTTAEVDNDTSGTTASIGASSSKEYKRIYWEQLPTSMSDELDLGEGNVEIIGYLSSAISNDKSTAYVYNTHVDLTGKEFYDIDETAGIKLLDIDLSDITNYDNKEEYDEANLSAVELTDGQEFVKIKGRLTKSSSTDVFSNKREWYIKVDSIEITEDIGDEVAEYEKFANSDEYEALSESLNYAGDILYYMANDDSYTRDDEEENEYDIEETINGIAEKYPIIYATTESSLRAMEKLVLSVENYEDTVGTSGNDYDTLYDLYTEFILGINEIGLLE